MTMFSGVFSISNAKPTDSVAAQTQLSNQGTLEADHVELAFSVNGDEADGNGHDEGDTYDSSAGMTEQFEVTHLSYPKDGSFVSKDDVADTNGNGISDLEGLAPKVSTTSTHPIRAVNGPRRSGLSSSGATVAPQTSRSTDRITRTRMTNSN